ncbi:MAG: aminopeptidase P family protein [Elusimicrobia bacterium]|nr:aminopeptidase P family protein [Elusimicrobiota bacterium]
MTERRRDRLRERCRDQKVDGYLTFDYSDVFYLSGFPSEGCFLLVSRGGDFLFSPLLLAEQARSIVDRKLSVVTSRKLLKSLESAVRKDGLKKVGYDSAKVTVSLFKSFSSGKGMRWVPLDGFVLKQRMIKDENEIELISQACHATFVSRESTFGLLREGQTEREVARALEGLFFKAGASKTAFETIVAFQENAAYPHHVVSDKKLSPKMAVLMDCGCAFGGYRSDLTRTGFFGKISSQFQKIYGIVKKSQSVGMAAVRPGVTAGKIDFVCREVIRKAGYGDYFVHGTGHGVGLDIHEPPRLGIGSKEVLREGMVVTVEPGIYLPGEFGVRIEDTLLVTKNGCEVLTQ